MPRGAAPNAHRPKTPWRGLARALGDTLEGRLVPIPAAGRVLRLGMVKSTLHGTNGAVDRTVANQQMTVQLGRHRRNEGVPIGRIQAGGGVGDGEELRP